MSDSTKIKTIVKEKYGQIARKPRQTENCSCSCCCSDDNVDYSLFNEDYKNIDGYVEEADLGLGCGLPTKYAGIKEGDVVLDLGSGAGNDVFVARSIVGETGRVIGVDMTHEMIHKANVNKQKMGYSNVEFRLGEIENLPVDDDSVDVVVSNCVLNLVPDKAKAFSEIFRVLKSDGHFCISDIVLKGELPDNLKKSAEMYAGCVAGASQQSGYLKVIRNTGFSKIEIKTSKRIPIPDSTLKLFLSDEEIRQFKSNGVEILSITVVGCKP